MRDKGGKVGMSFRTRLWLYGILLALIVAIPSGYQLGQRPWSMLKERVAQGHVMLGTLSAAVAADDMAQMRHFTLEMIALVPGKLGEVAQGRESDDYYPLVAPGQAFNLLITQGELLSEDALIKLFEEQELVYTSFSYTRFAEWYRFWEQELAARPGLRDIFTSYKQQLSHSATHAGDLGFEIADLYLMFDMGTQSEGFFRENIAFVLESLPWWESAYPGQAYNLVETDSLYWRASYDRAQGGVPGYNSAQVSDPDNWYLPQVDVDDWGAWFTVWYSEGSAADGGYIIYAIDFDATTVQQSMWGVASTLLGTVLLLTLIIALVAHLLSRRMTRPIEALTEGARAVMRGDCTHVVPRAGCDEFTSLIGVFNQMVQWVREMGNLKQSLSKLLSAELAEKAAKEGLVLGGQSVECTILFTDFAAFSALSRKMKAEDVVGLLNRYFGELVPVIKQWGGFPDKYIGDAVVAIFGAPVHFENHAEQAVKAAIEMQRRLRVLNEAIRQEHGIVFEMRIGINSGDVIVGAIGCDMKLEYTSIGDTTNLANRMESRCPVGHVMITGRTYELLHGCDLGSVRIVRQAEGLQVKGYSQAVPAYAVMIDDLEIATPDAVDDPHYFYRYQRTDMSRAE